MRRPDIDPEKRPERTGNVHNSFSGFMQRLLILLFNLLLIGFPIIYIIISVFYFRSYCARGEINIAEIRYYIFTFLFICALMVFGVLRIYNSIVANTGYLVQLKSKLSSFMISLKNFTNSFERTAGHLSNSLDGSKKLTDVLERLIKAIKNTDAE